MIDLENGHYISYIKYINVNKIKEDTGYRAMSIRVSQTEYLFKQAKASRNTSEARIWLLGISLIFQHVCLYMYYVCACVYVYRIVC